MDGQDDAARAVEVLHHDGPGGRSAPAGEAKKGSVSVCRGRPDDLADRRWKWPRGVECLTAVPPEPRCVRTLGVLLETRSRRPAHHAARRLQEGSTHREDAHHAPRRLAGGAFVFRSGPVSRAMLTRVARDAPPSAPPGERGRPWPAPRRGPPHGRGAAGLTGLTGAARDLRPPTTAGGWSGPRSTTPRPTSRTRPRGSGGPRWSSGG